jgi:LuxR family transcriptional regulator, maltose regulon positive regulatory protein
MQDAPFSVLHTKLTVPVVGGKRVVRSRLTERVASGLQHPLTVICAPAGFGKTTLITDCLEQMGDIDIAWLSLDDDDNDLTRFLIYITAALGTILPHVSDDMMPLLAATPTPPAKVLLTELLNHVIVPGRPVALVLDDYHLLTQPQIHEAVSFFLEHLPTRLRLLITSRSDPPLPLARLRARGQLVEIRADDLRFTLEEATLFLRQMLGMEVIGEHVRALTDRTEGWITGLQLAALAMQGRRDISAFVGAFSGSQRFVLDYLLEEVINYQPEAVRQFLLQTAILERLCAPLCAAVTGKEQAQSLLEQIERSNLFLIPLDDERYWYRYHHLFADVLRNRLKQTQPGNTQSFISVPVVGLNKMAWLMKRLITL